MIIRKFAFANKFKILIIFSILAMLFAGNVEAIEGQSKLKVGLVLPVTGDSSQYGIAMNKGAQLAVEEYNLKNPAVPIELILEDSQGLPKLGVTATEKLIQQDQVPIIISAFSGVLLASVPIAERNEVVVLNGPANSPKLRGLSPYLFNLMVLSDQEGKFLADVAYTRLGKRKVGIFYTNNDSGKGFFQTFSDEFTSKGGKVVLAEGHDQNASDFRTSLFKAKKEKLDLIFVAAYYKEAALLIKQAREIGIKIPFLSYSAVESPEFLKLAGTAAEGVIYSQPGYDTYADSTIVKSFTEAYKKKYNEDPNIWAAQFYDSAQVIISAIKNLNEMPINGPNLKKTISGMNSIEGVTGTLAFDNQGTLDRNLNLKIVKNSKFIKYK